MSRNGIENGQLLDLAFIIRVESTKAASRVLLSRLNPKLLLSEQSIGFSCVSHEATHPDSDEAKKGGWNSDRSVLSRL